MSKPREDKNPVVIGRLGRSEARPTITFYGHYDVQPAMEREWTTDPFQVWFHQAFRPRYCSFCGHVLQ